MSPHIDPCGKHPQTFRRWFNHPFITRYRKEITGEASDEQLHSFEEIYIYAKKLFERKEEVKRLISERSELSVALSKLIDDFQSLQQIEDLYRPYKEKKNTRAALAIASGLEPLADKFLF